ncbi:MAG TPA: hypothetical protein VIV06_05145 [Candidatus Limnocylindrales bacterium]
MNDKACWYRDCTSEGLPRPLFAQSHRLHASLRLCERHLSELARDPDSAAARVERPRG